MSYIDLEHACSVFFMHMLYLGEISNSPVKVLSTEFLVIQLSLILIV